MSERQFSEADLRTMLDDAFGIEPDIEVGRWVIKTRWVGRRWDVVVEPDAGLQRLVIVTAYLLE